MHGAGPSCSLPCFVWFCASLQLVGQGRSTWSAAAASRQHCGSQVPWRLWYALPRSTRYLTTAVMRSRATCPILVPRGLHPGYRLLSTAQVPLATPTPLLEPECPSMGGSRVAAGWLWQLAPCLFGTGSLGYFGCIAVVLAESGCGSVVVTGVTRLRDAGVASWPLPVVERDLWLPLMGGQARVGLVLGTFVFTVGPRPLFTLSRLLVELFGAASGVLDRSSCNTPAGEHPGLCPSALRRQRLGAVWFIGLCVSSAVRVRCSLSSDSVCVP
jgi:hypothetical protein